MKVRQRLAMFPRLSHQAAPQSPGAGQLRVHVEGQISLFAGGIQIPKRKLHLTVGHVKQSVVGSEPYGFCHLAHGLRSLIASPEEIRVFGSGVGSVGTHVHGFGK
jgi:hypothetical protein